MGQLENLGFELERRVALFKSTTTMPDGTQLGYNGDPNMVSQTGTPGEYLIYVSPTGTRYQQNDGTQWYKKTAPNTWAQFGTGTGGSFTGGTINSGINVFGNVTGVTFTSTATGSTDPLIINSTKIVTNLNADLLDGTHASGFTSQSKFDAYTASTETLISNKFNNTGGAITGDLIVESGYTISGDGSGLTNIPSSAVTISTIQFGENTAEMTENGLSINTGVTISGPLISVGSADMVESLNAQYLGGKQSSQFSLSGHTHLEYSQTGHTHSQLYHPVSGTQVVYVDAAGYVHIDGGIIQQGSGYTTSTEQILSTSDYIFLRSGATGSLPSTGYTGFEVIKYDGVKNARMVFDKNGIARVGDVGNEQPLVTRLENTGMTDNKVTYWKNGKLQTSTISISDITTNSGTSVNGGAFIYNVTPNSGNVSSLIKTGDTYVLDSFLTDTINVRVYVYAVTGNKHFKPTVNVNGNLVTNLSQVSNSTLFTGYTNLILEQNITTGITVTHEDGASHTTLVNWDSVPIITSARFIGTYPGTQTELKSGDTFNISVTGNTPFTQIELLSGGAFEANTFNVTSTTATTINGVITNKTTGTYGVQLRIKKSNGSTSATYTISGTTNGVDRLNLNNTYPTINIITTSYPSLQTALKNSEFATINHTISNYDSVSYTNSLPTPQLEITGSTTYTTEKMFTRISGGYNVDIPNLRITATKSSNGAVTIQNHIIKIANDTPTVTISGNSNRLRSGGNDNTSVQSYTITITSTQDILQTPSMGAASGGGSFIGTWTQQNSKTYTRTLQIHDNNARGTYYFSGISVKNLADITVVTATNDSYVIGGFVERTITSTVPKQDVYVINVDVSNENKLPQTLNWSFKSLTTMASVGTGLNQYLALNWCIDEKTVNNTKTNVRILDTSAVDAATNVGYSITISESV